MAFIPYGTLDANAGVMLIGGTAVPQKTICTNSQIFKIGDKIEWASGFIVAGANSTAAVDPVGILVGVCNENGSAATPDSGTTGTFTMTSDNQTVAKRYGIIDISENTLYSVGADAALGTTTGSNLPGYAMNAWTTGVELDESTAVTGDTGSASFFSWGVDPGNSERVIVNMATAIHHKLIA